MNTTSPVRPELVEGLDLREIADFENLRIAHWELINTKSFETNNQVHELMLLYALQINDLSHGLSVLKMPITNDGHVLQQSHWVLLRVLFETTIKLCYLCCDPKMMQARFDELECDGIRDEIKILKALKPSFFDERKADTVIQLVEKRLSDLQNVPALKMEKRIDIIGQFDGNEGFADVFKIFWKRLCGTSHSRPCSLYSAFLRNSQEFFEPFSKLKPDSSSEIVFTAACLLSMASRFLSVLPDKNSKA